MPTERLTPRQQKFCIEILKDMNASKAAIRAGYSPKTADAASSRLMRHPKVINHLGVLRSQQEARTLITADRVLRELAKIAFVEVPEEKYKGNDKVRALRNLGEHLGLFSDYNTAIATLSQYGSLEPTEDGHVFRRASASANP